MGSDTSKPEQECPQEFWFRKCEELAPPTHKTSSEYEAPARAWLVAELRRLADHIEKGGYPDVFGCKIPEGGVQFRKVNPDSFIEEWVVVLSHLWPG